MIHAGAEQRCPVCGYSLKRARAVFGDRELLFTRVVDEAGALTHSERMVLMKVLEDLERGLPPIALGIYITSHGILKEFRPHAHWALNQAVIHHPSYGRREQMRAIEDADLSEAQAGEREKRAQNRAGEGGRWTQFCEKVRNFVHPYPPPVRQEWMLILVVDVQLEIACFSWGYMLDPYINPERINTAIMGSRLYFRERAMVPGLRKVMKAAVRQITAQSHRVNRRINKGGAAYTGASMLLCGLFAAAPLQAAPVVLLGDDEAAEEVEETAEPADEPQPKPQEKKAGCPATQDAAPRWNSEDYYHLLSGELEGCYAVLRGENPLPPPAEDEGAQQRTNRRDKVDNRVYKLYYKDYIRPNPQDGLIDPQGILSSPQREDVRYVLQTSNARSSYKIYVALVRKDQRLPLDMAAGALVREIANPGEYAVLLLYSWGDIPRVEIGYHELKPSDEERHAWQDRVQVAAQTHGDTAGILAALDELKKVLAPMAADLPPLDQRTELQVPLIPIELQQDEDAEEVSNMDEIKGMLAKPGVQKALEIFAILLLLPLLYCAWWWLRRRSGCLFPSEPDVRLSSPYGAGVSRTVHYLDGRESGSTPKFF